MRPFFLLVPLMALCAAAIAATPGSSMPDIARQYYERQNCHGAYDLLVEQSRSGSISDADRGWAKGYEDNALAGKSCPALPEALAKRASNRAVVTDEGLARIAKYLGQNDPAAYFEGGYAVLTGKVPKVEPAEGFGMVKKASDLGYAPAQFFLGLLHVAGNVTGKPDYAGALPLIEAAAGSGHVDALFQAANFYKEGLGTKKDPKKAFGLYQQAAERGHLYAAVMAYYMIQDGEGTKKDFNLAYRLARNLADRGEAYGAVMTAGALLQQKNVKQHEDEVLYWMDVAIRDGDERIKQEVGKFRPQVTAAYQRLKAPPEYHPRVRKLCPMKTVCLVDRFTGVQRCTSNVDYWNDCDG